MIIGRIKKKGGCFLALAWLICFAFLSTPAKADDEERQYKIEAAYLYNFFNYITWPGFNGPQDLHQPVICLYAGDPVEPYLIYIQHKRADERQIIIKHIEDNNASLEGCHLIFLRDHISIAGAHIENAGLIVSEKEGSVDQGAMIELFREEENIRMKINQTLLEKDNFRVSSRLLSLAEVLRK